jgi:hypothetical protein
MRGGAVCYDSGPALPGPTLRTELDTKVHAAQARVLAGPEGGEVPGLWDRQ